jgi:transcriptional regulator
MYLPPANEVDDVATIVSFVERHSFATLVSGAGSAPDVSHLPLVLRPRAGGHTIVGHVARANPHWRRMDGSAEALAMFMGPHAYVSPTWYATSPAVPTWNYAVVHAHGKPRVIDDATFTREVLRELVTRHEPGPSGWTAKVLSPEKEQSLVAAIVAFEMPVDRFEAKFKLGQNRSPADRQGTIAGLERAATPEAAALAAFMREHALPSG